jgi:hypothetical protein
MRTMTTLKSLKSRIGTWAIGAFAIAWLGAVLLGQRVILNYDYTAAAEGAPPAKWPQNSAIPRAEGLPIIVLAVHPRCPCTRATMEELARLMARLHNQATAAVVFVRPHGFSEEWEKTDLWRSAARIPGVTVLSDAEGREASRFGAQASGQTMLYSAAGDLQFSGGITGARGHSGDNLGRSTIVSLVTTGQSTTSHTSVYGCSLHDPERAVTD